MCDGPVAQWIEQLRPKEKVVRSTRTEVTSFVCVVLEWPYELGESDLAVRLAPKSPFLCDIINLWRGGLKVANGGRCFLGRKY